MLTRAAVALDVALWSLNTTRWLRWRMLYNEQTQSRSSLNAVLG